MARTLECTEQTFAFVDESLQFPARLLGPLREIPEHPLAVGANFRHDLATLLFGELELLLSLARDVRAPAGRLERRLLQRTCRLAARLTNDLLGGFDRPVAHGLRRLAGCSQHPCGLGTQQLRNGILVDGRHVGRTARLQCAQLVLEEPLTFEQPGHLDRHLPKEIPHLFFAVPATRHRELCRCHRRRRRRIRSLEVEGHALKSTGLLLAVRGIGQRIAADSAQDVECILEERNRLHPHSRSADASRGREILG